MLKILSRELMLKTISHVLMTSLPQAAPQAKDGLENVLRSPVIQKHRWVPTEVRLRTILDQKDHRSRGWKLHRMVAAGHHLSSCHHQLSHKALKL